MKKILFTPSLKGIAFALPLFVLFACCSSSVYSQRLTTATISRPPTRCFTITQDTSQLQCAGGGCNIQPGGLDMRSCTEHCITFRLCMDQCTGINPTMFTVTSNSSTDCHNVCSPGDFNVVDEWGQAFNVCSWYNNRTMVSVSSTGIADLQCVKFTICSAGTAQHTYTISLPAGTTCGGVTCPSITITF